MNVGKLLIGEKDGFVPCTPAGVHGAAGRSGVETRGAECVVVGRSNIVGKPMAALLDAGPGWRCDGDRVPQSDARPRVTHEARRHCDRCSGTGRSSSPVP